MQKNPRTCVLLKRTDAQPCVFDAHKGKIPFFNSSSVFAFKQAIEQMLFQLLVSIPWKISGFGIRIVALLLFSLLLFALSLFAITLFSLRSLLFRSSLFCSSLFRCALFCSKSLTSHYRATVSNLLLSLFKKKKLWVNCSCCSLQKNNHEWFAPVTLDIWTTLSKLFSSLFKKEQNK